MVGMASSAIAAAWTATYAFSHRRKELRDCHDSLLQQLLLLPAVSKCLPSSTHGLHLRQVPIALAKRHGQLCFTKSKVMWLE
ncbi:hypothetical protein RB195_017672 [Necator americanus]|uniref:Secreted protein n=1 Tax=Necator americanus TaxID=51031 RepID=A0ABR1C842_NECAM